VRACSREPRRPARVLRPLARTQRRCFARLRALMRRPRLHFPGLTDVLRVEFIGTLFAPTDAAITAAAISAKGSLQALLDDKALLAAILKNHVRRLGVC